MTDNNLKQALEIFGEMQQDSTVSKNVRLKISSMQKDLEGCSKDELSLVVNRVISELEELSNDMNIPMFVRTQIWSITGLLEPLC